MKTYGTASRYAAVTFALACIYGIGCGSDRPSFDEHGNPPPPAFVSDASAPSNDGEGPCATRCSADLHRILDCHSGEVIEECPPDKGCALGKCVTACASATANRSSTGCEFFAVQPDVVPMVRGACFAAFVANTWTTDVTLEVSRGGEVLDLSGFARIPQGEGLNLTYLPLENGRLPKGEVAVLFLNRFGSSSPPDLDFDCPAGVVPAVTASDTAFHGTGKGTAFAIHADRPVVAYDMFPFGGGQSAATSATLLLPTSAWGKNYIAVNAFRKSAVVADAVPFLSIVAAEDHTTITLLPNAAVVGGKGVLATSKGQGLELVLDRGQYAQIAQPIELSGSPIESDKPIGVWGGSTCLNVGVSSCCCDSAHQQIPPLMALGSSYVAVPHRNRFEGFDESPPWRIVGAVNGTKLTYDPAPPPGAPLIVHQGTVDEFNAGAPFTVRSQDAEHPFYMSGHMKGGDGLLAGDGRGDPEFVNVVPSAEYLDSYVFFTDPTYPETNLIFVREKSGASFEDVTLDCLGNISGWKPVGVGEKYEWAYVDLSRGNFVKQGSCNNGRHEAKSHAPFGLTVWGWGSAATGKKSTGGFSTEYVSYAYPAGASLRPVNDVVVPAQPK